MSYIGKEPQYTDFLSKFFSGDGTAMTVTLDASPPNEAALLVFIDGVRQDTSAYTVSGYSLTFTGAVPSGTNNVQVVHLGIAQDTQVPVDDSVSTAKIQDDAVTSAKLDTNIAIDGDLTVDTDTLYVDSTNNRVGIGTSSPSFQLEVRTASGERARIGDGTNNLDFFPTTGQISTGGDILLRAFGSSGAVTFGSGASAPERMRVDSSGNVGIGTTSPAGIVGGGKTLALYNNSHATISVQAVESVNDRNATLELLSSGNGNSTSDIIYGDTDTSPATPSPLRFLGRHSGSTTERMRIDSSGKVTMATTTVQDSATLTVKGSSVAQICCEAGAASNGFTAIFFRNPNGAQGQITTNSTSVSYQTFSDYRLKENVVSMTNATDRLKQLKPKRFNFIADADTTVDGFLAHEVQSVVPEAISGTKDAMKTEEYEITPAVFNDEGVETTAAVMGTREVPEYQGMDQSKLVPLLTSALQEAIAKIESLEARVATLEAN